MTFIHVVLDSPKTAKNGWGRTKGLSLPTECSNSGWIDWCSLWVPAINHSHSLKLLHRFISPVLLIQGLTVNGEISFCCCCCFYFYPWENCSYVRKSWLQSQAWRWKSQIESPNPNQEYLLIRFHYYDLNVQCMHITYTA